MSSSGTAFVSGYSSQTTGAQTRLTAAKRKYTRTPTRSMPTGQTCAATTEPTAPPDAARLRPLARRAVGKIWEGQRTTRAGLQVWRGGGQGAGAHVEDRVEEGAGEVRASEPYTQAAGPKPMLYPSE